MFLYSCERFWTKLIIYLALAEVDFSGNYTVTQLSHVLNVSVELIQIQHLGQTNQCVILCICSAGSLY